MEGFAAWLPWSKIAASWLDVVRFGGIALPFSIGLRPLRKLFAYMDHSEEMRQRHIRPPFWYLQLLGVDPRRHGKGHGALLLRSMLSRLDRENIPSCLDTENESNVAMYEHFGFRVVESSTIPRSNSPIWLMAREVVGKTP
jgi:ribosomal protein S18 acetylase RimI-like enzyme